ncbi:MAG: YkvA family protein [Saprospiraceae bacterium]
MKKIVQKYRTRFSEVKLWHKLTSYARQAGIKTVYTALLMFFAYRRKDTPKWAKNIIIGLLGYFLAPIDIVPDLSPFVGYTDDLSLLSVGLVTVAGYINKEVKEQAREKLKSWFGEYDPEELAEIDNRL